MGSLLGELHGTYLNFFKKWVHFLGNFMEQIVSLFEMGSFFWGGLHGTKFSYFK